MSWYRRDQLIHLTKAELVELVLREDARADSNARDEAKALDQLRSAKLLKVKELRDELADVKESLLDAQLRVRDLEEANGDLFDKSRHESSCHGQGDPLLSCTCRFRQLQL